MASFATRSFLRSPSVRCAAQVARVSSSKATAYCALGTSRCIPKSSSASFRILRRAPAVLSCCVESLLPFHSAKAEAVMTSMLSVSMRGYGRLSEAGNDDV
ncbi:hypothetical protein HPP92_021005 [Vanilla planifolia]|uniref:Protein NUCLEAR FUSION DEFECTIVE 6, chloroplastic/mitochondrial-like n=1 Tax=Vanilla planifolia TaxID=51239 RepID=A0A835UHF9_VANPL|nr:hypothetical protein HPP92_021317 [Vanilla planifolia]KAG0462529.1 hypothetical protein HPP92_021005 [Vanilla planifolia]